MATLLGITDLDAILKELKLFSKEKWDTFGLEAGLYQPTLNAIEANHNNDVDKCFRECVSCWLQKQDKVEEKGVPTWLRLAGILEEVGDKALAENIREKAGIDGSSSEAMTTVVDIDDYDDWQEEYFAMDRKFSNILNRAIKEIFAENLLDDVKVSLAGIYRSMTKAIEETNNKVQLMALLRNCFSLSNISTLKEFFEQWKIKHSAHELDELLKNRDAIYKKILAKDFASKAIEIYEDSERCSTITFKVIWKVDEATLMDFELFLDKAFHSHKKYIHLKVIKQSLLTFVCTIPDWLVEKLSDYVKENKDFIISQGVVAVTTDNAVIFNVEGDYAALIFYEPNDIMTFTVVPSNKLTALLKFIKEQHQFAEVDLIHYFCFESLHGFVELRFTEKPPTGWKIMPNIKPCRLYQDDIDNFSGGSAPPFCQISVHGLPFLSTEPLLHYPVSLRGIKSPATLYIHKAITSTIPLFSSASYTGIIYYERKEDKHLMTFVAATKLTFLVKYIEDHHPLAMIKQLVNFNICSPGGRIKLIFDALTEDKQSNEWTAKPQTFKLLQDDIDKFDGELDDSIPPLCVIPVFGSPDAKSMLHYSLSLEGGVEPIKRFFDLKLSSSSDELYTGLVYYEWKVSEYLMTFIAGRNLSSLIQYIEEYHPMAEVDQIVSFTFSSHHYIELKFDSLQNDSLNNGWTIQPLVKPCRLYQSEIDRFNEPDYPLPPSCLVSVYGSPDAVSSLNYSVPLVGVANPVTLFVHRKLQLERHVTELYSDLHLLQGANDKLKKEEYEKEQRIAASKKKLYEVSEKLSIMAKEKQELIKRVATLEKQQEQPKLFAYDVSKLEAVLQPMDNQWYQLGHHLNVEVSLLREIEQKKDTKEQMRSLLQLCSDRGVTMMQLEEALVALDQKSLIPGLKEFLSFSTSELLETETPDEEGRLTQNRNLAQEELKAELQEVKAALEVCQFEKEELQSAKENLKNDVTLKDSTIATLVNEKSQLMEREQSIRDDKDLIDLTSQFKEMKSIVDGLLSKQQKILSQNEDLKAILMHVIKIVSEFITEEMEKKLQHCINSLHHELQVLQQNKLPVKEPRQQDEHLIILLQEIKCVSDKVLLPIAEKYEYEDWKAKLKDIEIITNEIELSNLTTLNEGHIEAKVQETKDVLFNILGQQLLTLKELHEANTRAFHIQQQLTVEGDDLREKIKENKTLIVNALSSSGEIIAEAKAYAGLVYYETNGAEDLVTFTAAWNSNALFEYVRMGHPTAEIGTNIYFKFEDGQEYVDFIFDALQLHPFTGWNINPHISPCRLYQKHMDDFGKADCPFPPSCLISVYGSSNAVPSLHYAVPLVGVADPVTLYIHRSLRIRPTSPVATSPAVGPVAVVTATSSVQATRGGGIDVKTARQKLKQVLVTHHADLSEVFQYSLRSIANELLQVDIITHEVQKSATYDSMIGSFVSAMSLKHTTFDLEKHCVKFLKALSKVRGPVADAADMIQAKWIEAVESELEFKF